MEELEQVKLAIETLAEGYLNCNSAWFGDNDELQEVIDRAEADKILVINYINKLVEKNKELQLKVDVLNDYDYVITD